MTTRTKAKRDPIVRIQEAVDELFDALHELDDDEQFRALAPYVDADTVDNVIHLLSIIMEEAKNRKIESDLLEERND